MNNQKLTRRFAAPMIAAAAAVAATSPAFAGEVTGNGKEIDMHGRSLCSFSGQNDTPGGLTIQVAPGVFVQIDPGGQVQSYGYFKAREDFFDSPSDPGARDQFAFPAFGCNPNAGDSE